STSAPGFAPSFSDRSGTGEELALLLARERRALLARLEAPGERVARRLLQRAEGQPGCQGAGDVRLEEAGVLRARQPERQLHPGADACIEQRLAVDPHEPVGSADALERLAERQRLRGPRRVEDAARPLLCEPHEERAEVASVDQLDALPGIPRSEHGPALGEPPRPVREAVGRVVRPDDEAGARDRGALAEDLLHHTLRAGLQAAVLLR